MRIIKCLTEKIKEEIKDADAYISLAEDWRNEEPDTAELFYELSTEEMGHAERLHDAVVEMIGKYREQHGDPPKVMLELYDYMHAQQIEESMRVKIKQGMYKS